MMRYFVLALLCVCLPLASVGTGAIAPAGLAELEFCLKSAGVHNVTTLHVHPHQHDSVWRFSLQNLRYAGTWVPKAAAIVLPATHAEVQSTVRCCVSNGWHMRVRSGGHNYEAQSSWSDVASYVILDLMLLDSVHVDISSETAWVDAGTTLGNLYAAITNLSDVYGFPAGTCPTVGVGGFISGGGYGMLTRKYGLAADYVDDALLVDAHGNILDREAMGEDVFWALRGGGGGSFGVVVAWKLCLVKVPRVVTVFTLDKTGCEAASILMHKWQFVAPSVDDELQLRTTMALDLSTSAMTTKFYGMYLGGKENLLRLMDESFPELGLGEVDCMEMSYYGSVDYYAQEFIGRSMVDRYFTLKAYFKFKSEFVERPISRAGYDGFCRLIEQRPGANALITPWGGAMARIPSDASPFPHRGGNLMIIHYGLVWCRPQSAEEDSKSLDYVKRMEEYLRPFVSGGKYVNYLDLDLGHARNGTVSVEEARKAWGEPYFGRNFERLVKAKTIIDLRNVFRSAQSIPPLGSFSSSASLIRDAYPLPVYPSMAVGEATAHNST